MSKDDQYSWDMDSQSNARYHDQVPYGSQESYDDTASTYQQQPSGQQSTYQPSTDQQQPTDQPSTAQQASEQAPADTSLPQTRAATVALMAGLCIFVIHRLPLLSFICAIVAFIAALIAFCRIKTGRFSGKVSAIIGLVIGVFSLAFFFPGSLIEIRTMENEGLLPNFSATSTFSHNKARSMEDGGWQKQRVSQNRRDDNYRTKDKELKGAGSIPGADVTIVSAHKGPKDDEGKPTVIITYQYKNTDHERRMFMQSTTTSVLQNNDNLSLAFLHDGVDGFDEESQFTSVEPKQTVTVTEAYQLKDDSPVTVKVSPGVDHDDQTTIVQTFPMQ